MKNQVQQDPKYVSAETALTVICAIDDDLDNIEEHFALGKISKIKAYYAHLLSEGKYNALLNSLLNELLSPLQKLEHEQNCWQQLIDELVLQ